MNAYMIYFGSAKKNPPSVNPSCFTTLEEAVTEAKRKTTHADAELHPRRGYVSPTQQPLVWYLWEPGTPREEQFSVTQPLVSIMEIRTYERSVVWTGG